MKKIMFDSKIGLEHYVLTGQKTMTRRVVPPGIMRMALKEQRMFGGSLEERIMYHVPIMRETFAIAQSYKDIVDNIGIAEWHNRNLWCTQETIGTLSDSRGWNNKMYVRADLMPHQIQITDYKVERLQDISKEDCLKEGIDEDFADGLLIYWYSVYPFDKKISDKFFRHEFNGEKGCFFWDTPQRAFAALINYISPKIDGQTCWDANPYVYAYEFNLIR